jgi:hypothetical protein
VTLHVVPDTPKPDDLKTQARDRIKRMPKPKDMLQCPRCGGRELIEARTGVMYQNGRTSGGTKQLLCSLCMVRGERVVVV